MFMSLRKILVLSAFTVLASTSLSEAADPAHIKRAQDGSAIGECLRCDLTNADMRKGFFQLANLIEADFTGSKIDGANMAGAQLQNAKMANVSATFTNFSGAQLQGVDFRNANLTKAWFNWAWLAGAKLDGANFSGAVMLGAQLQGADMSKVVGLTKDQLIAACGDADTRVPKGISRPECRQ